MDGDEESDLEMDHEWHFRYNRRLSCTSHAITSVAFSPDGKWFISGSASGMVNVWDTNSWAEAAKLKTQRLEEPRGMLFSPAQRWLVAAYASVLHIFSSSPPWRLEETLTPMAEPATKEAGQWYCVAFSPMSEVDHPKGSTGQDNHLACFSTHFLSVMDYSGGWGPDTPKRTRSLQAQSRPTNLQYTSTGWWIVAGFESGQLQVWNAFSLTLERTLGGHTAQVTCLCCSPRAATQYEPRAVSCSVDQSLRLWHTCGWTLEQICVDVKCDRNGVRCCTFSTTGNWLVSLSNELCVWRVCVTKRAKVILRLHQRLSAACGAEGLRTVAICRFGDAVAVGSRDGVLGLWTKAAGMPPALPPEPLEPMRATGPPSSAGAVSPWSPSSRPLSRPMSTITPDGMRPVGQASAAARAGFGASSRDWFQRTNLRSVAVLNTLERRPVQHFSASTAASAVAALAVGATAANSPSGTSSLAKRDSMFRDCVGGDILGMQRSATHGDLNRWRQPASFEFEAFVTEGRQLAAAAVRQRSGSLATGGAGAVAGGGAGAGGTTTASLEDEMPLTAARKRMHHACRGLVERITLDAETVPMLDRTI
eukprot:TRINITY_DN11795_c0_g1_i1.p1 TRINITY_DN11795_c0_g1~~TRINITY_DN11795_c0_g1_i1.p1  ORF type:complete len:591 (+),score=106.25 TRINITY_DN11795_c0_g1_i1:154-1926(+)